MNTRAQQYAAQFEAANDEIIAAVQACPPGQWRITSANDERSVAVVAHHVASVNGAFTGMVSKLASGETYMANTSMEEIHRMNAEHAREHAGVERQDVLDLLRANGSAMLELLRGISDERLDEDAGSFGGNPFTVAQVIEYIVVGHTAEHAASIRAAIGQQATPAG